MSLKNQIAGRRVGVFLPETCEALENRRLLSALAGALIGSTGSYQNQGNVAAYAFDGNFNTFFDAPSGSGNWVGLNLQAPAVITEVQYAPRAIFASRMVGGVFQGSNTPGFSAGVVNLFTITTLPAYGLLTSQPITNTTAFQFVRYLGPSSSYCNISELQFDGTLQTNPTLQVTPSGTAGSWENQGNVYTNAFDGNLNTFFDAPTGNGDYVQAAFSSEALLSQVLYAPRSGFAGRMVGGVFQASNSATFAAGVVNLYTITAAPPVGVFTAIPINLTAAYQYVRYLAPAGSYGDIAELEFEGTLQTDSILPVTPSGTAGSWDNLGNVYTNAFDGNLNTFFDAPAANGDYVQAAFSSEALLSEILYAPRSGFAGRMVGGIFQASNSATFTAGAVDLYTITVAPPAGIFTSIPLNLTAAYEYVRYLAPAGSYGNIAELEFEGTLTGLQPGLTNPSIANTSPTNGATGVSTTAFVSCNLNLPNGAGVDPGTMTSTTVYLERTFDDSIIPTEVNTDAAGSVIVLQPQSPLNADTQYTFVVTAGVEDDTSTAFIPFSMSFTTGAQTAPSDPSIAFAKVALPTAVNQMFSGVQMGPDGNLYANTLTGGIFEFPVNANGTLGNPINIAALAGMPDRLITGLAFQPGSTATNMTMWISSGNPLETNAPDFSGTIGAITISNGVVSPYVTYVVGLPRSNSNHLNNQPVFGPDGALYWGQGSNTSMGAPDPVWGYRVEHLLNAAILRLNIQLVEQYVATNNQPLNVQTDSLPAGQTPYNPYAAGAPLTIYATGLRNTYDLIWDTNGHLYAPTNGAAAGGNIPATPPGVTPAAPAETGVAEAEDDYLFDVVQGGYYGHPDPARGQYIYGGGNPVNPAPDTEILDSYPLGTMPDPNYRGYIYDFGVHYSPDGSIEYTGNAFGGALNGALLITEYSGGKDVLALTTGSSGQITGTETGIAGFTGFEDPVSITENPSNGDLYVADLGTNSITLLTPISSGGTISVSTPTLYFNAPVNGAASATESITISNIGSQPLAIPATGLSVAGADGALFPFSNEPQLPADIAPGGSITVALVFNPGDSAIGLQTAQLQISSNDLVNPLMTVNLRALTTAGLGGSLQPSLQAILNFYQIPDNTGTTSAAQSYFTVPPSTPNDEVVMQELKKAGSGPVTITPLAAFDADISPAAGFGYYTAGTPDSRTQLFTVAAANSQSVDPVLTGSTSFDPGSSVFGIYGSFDALLDSATNTASIAYSEDALNTYGTVTQRMVRFYPLKNSSGTVVPNEFVFAIDDDAASPLFQYTNLVGIITNVTEAPGAPVIGTQNVDGSDNESAPSPLQFVFSGIASSNSSAPSAVRNTAELRITNTGSLPLMISSMNSSNAFFSVSTPLTYPLTIAAGGGLNVTLAYNPVHTGATAADNGVLTIDSNDPVHPALALQLSGLWEGTATPTLAQIVSTYGYTSLGNETLSAYWTRADTNLPVTVQELGAFSGKTSGSTLYWYTQGNTSSFNSIVSIPGDNTQTLLPVENDTTQAPAIGSFSTSSVFGFSIDKTEFSDDSLNAHGSATDLGHHVKFWQLYNSAGQAIPNTWLMAMSYTSSAATYAYTDNVYLIQNIRPAAPAMPTGTAAVGSIAGNTFSWNAVTSPLVKGYLLYRNTTSGGSYSLLYSGAYPGTSYLDTTAVPGVKYYYTVAAENTFGTLSSFTTSVTATRPQNTVAPAVPANLQASANGSNIILSWSPNSEIDLAGYNVYRANSINGTYFKLNSSPITSTSFTDISSPVGVTSYYHVTAINASGTESAPASISATVPPPVSKTVTEEMMNEE